ncbi:MAG: hypothetical protein ACK4M1_12440 [Flavobacterium sp.]
MKEKRLKIDSIRIIILNIVILLSIVSCKKTNEKEDEFSISPNESFIEKFGNTNLTDSLKSRIHKGDTIAYDNLKEIYYLSGYKKEFFFYSYYMAKNFKYIDAYEDCFSNLKHTKNDNSDAVLNKSTEYFLLKAYEKNPKSLEHLVIEFYGEKENIPKSDSILVIK